MNYFTHKPLGQLKVHLEINIKESRQVFKKLQELSY